MFSGFNRLMGMKKWVLLSGLFYAWWPVIAQDRADYIELYKDIAVTEMLRTGIPASIKLAQAILESDCGRSELARKANNHFGIKCGNDWKGKSFKKEDDDYENGKLVKSCFREFRNAYDSYVAHSEFLLDPAKSKRYGSLFALDQSDYKSWAKGLSKAGYATDPQYARRLIDLIEKYDLHQYDQQDSREVASVEPKPGAALSLIQYNNDVKYVVATAGATPSSIAHEFDVTVRQVVRYNDDIDNEEQLLVEGSKVYIQPKRNQSRGRQKTHLLKEGETLIGISQHYGIKVEALMKRNGLLEGEIPAPDQKIVLKGKSNKKLRTRNPFEIPDEQHKPIEPVLINEEASVAPAVPMAQAGQQTTTVVTVEQNQVAPPKTGKEHIVTKGETLYSISRQYGLSQDELKKINNLSADTIFIGQKLALQ